MFGGVASIPVTVWLYLQSSPENEFSLSAVFLGGLLAGYLVSTTATETDVIDVGFRAGVIGALPVLWILVDFLEAATVLGGPLWFQVIAVSMVVLLVTSVILGVAGFIGLLGAKVGGWLAKMTGTHQTPSVEN
ncbi:DUF5518 domain-containing protein [Halomicroarcula sp. GCM10025324]|uniref:DUF5518 domain-containing protein n=1 Tax=Halomicroarcula sp. GCM10025324 TaxID=3252667 RepID=UPI00361552E2